MWGRKLLPILVDGRKIAWGGGGNFPLTPVRTADGTAPVAVQTVVRDRAIIPGKSVTFALGGLVEGIRADDTGGAISGYRLDFYGGAGNAACSGSSNAQNNPILVEACSKGLATCPLSDLP